MVPNEVSTKIFYPSVLAQKTVYETCVDTLYVSERKIARYMRIEAPYGGRKSELRSKGYEAARSALRGRKASVYEVSTRHCCKFFPLRRPQEK